VLRRVGDALAPEGTFLMSDFKFSSQVEDNVGNSFAPLCYRNNGTHGRTVSLAEGAPAQAPCGGSSSRRAR
jgi:hypothetical protein